MSKSVTDFESLSRSFADNGNSGVTARWERKKHDSNSINADSSDAENKKPSSTTTVATVQESSAAAQAGLLPGDRILALDTLYVNTIALLVLAGLRDGSTIYFEAALVIAMLGFVGTVVLSKYVIRRDIIE